MRKVVFYSWQSDLPNSQNRSFIENALSKAIKAIGRDNTSDLDPVIDRDTTGISGSPDISSSIFAKIAVADIFVADVTIVSADAAKPTPNPNVLIELGYAIAQLGWSRIILIANSSFGGPELLPFDLRGHRIIFYCCKDNTDRIQERGILQGRLESALREELEGDIAEALSSGRSAKIWWGKWDFRRGPGMIGQLFIREIGTIGFLFDIETAHGSHTGQLTAWARFITKDLAYCRVSNKDLAPDGEILFRRSEDGKSIIVEEATSCTYHHGMRGTFSGVFTRGSEPLVESGFLNEIELSRLYNLTGEHFEGLVSCIGDISPAEILDSALNECKAIAGGLAGLYTIAEYIIIVGSYGEVWAAYLLDNTISYFTNVPSSRNIIPNTIEKWAERFTDCQKIMCPAVSSIPSRYV